MKSIIQCLYFKEFEEQPSSSLEEFYKAYQALYKTFSPEQLKLFIKAEKLYNDYFYQEHQKSYELGFKTGARFTRELLEKKTE